MTPEQSRRDEAGRWLAQAQKDLNACTPAGIAGAFPIGLPQSAGS